MKKLDLIAVNSLRGVLGELVPEMAHGLGAECTVRYLPTTVAVEEISSGRALADVVIATDSGISVLNEGGLIATGSVVAIAASDLGVGTSSSAEKAIDIGSVAGFGASLRDVASIAYASKGASAAHFLAAAGALGIDEMIIGKSVTIEGGLAGELVIDGRAEIAVQMIPELMAVPGLTISGPLPPPFGTRLTLHAAVPRLSVHPTLATEFIDLLASPKSRPILEASGFVV